MSEENVDILRGAFEAFARGDFWQPELFAQDVRIKWLDAVGAESETVGLQAMSSFVLNFLESWDELTLAADRFIDAGDQVVVFAAWRGRGKISGATTEWPFAAIWSMRGGRVTRIESFTDQAEALEAAGLADGPR